MKKISSVLLFIVLVLPCMAQQKANVFTIPAAPISEAVGFILSEFQLIDPATRIKKIKITAKPDEFKTPKATQRIYYTKDMGAETFLKMALASYQADYEFRDDTLIIKAKSRTSSLIQRASRVDHDRRSANKE
jgi:hypothetical protein